MSQFMLGVVFNDEHFHWSPIFEETSDLGSNHLAPQAPAIPDLWDMARQSGSRSSKSGRRGGRSYEGTASTAPAPEDAILAWAADNAGGQPEYIDPRDLTYDTSAFSGVEPGGVGLTPSTPFDPTAFTHQQFYNNPSGDTGAHWDSDNYFHSHAFETPHNFAGPSNSGFVDAAFYEQLQPVEEDIYGLEDISGHDVALTAAPTRAQES